MTKSYDYRFIRPSTAKLQSRNLDAQCWYHGKIKRVHAQGLLNNDGDFLVRDSITNASGYVLTGMWHGQPMHFEVHSCPSSESGVILYHFEDEQFRSVVDLIEFYHTHRRKVTASSGFILGRPIICNQRAYTLSQSDLLHACSTENFQIEIEATYAPFLGKPTTEKPAPLRHDRNLTQHAILNQAKKRLNGTEYKSEHDLVHMNTGTSNFIGNSPMANSRSVFYVNHLDYSTINYNTPRLSGKTSLIKEPPKIPLPISPIAMPEDVDDYCEMDYAAMELRVDELRVDTPSPTSFSSTLLSSPSSVSRKRYSEILDSSMTDLQSNTFDTPEINPNNPFRRSAHSLNHNLITPTSAEPYDEESSNLPSYLDRTQSCQNLYGVRMKLNRSVSGTSYGQAMDSPMEPETEFKRFPSIKIEPSPILPARSTTNLNSTVSPIKETAIDPDYDKIVINTFKKHDSDYGCLQNAKINDEADDHSHKNGQKKKLKVENGQTEDYFQPTSSYANGFTTIKPPTAPKPSLAKLKAHSQIGKGMRQLCHFLTTNDPKKVALLISMEDCRVFELFKSKQFNQKTNENPLAKLFLSESSHYREEIMDRNIVLHLAVSLSIQKANTLFEIIRSWIQIASLLFQDIGNAFAFGSIMSALKNELMKKIRRWSDNEIDTYNLFYLKLLPIFDKLTSIDRENKCFLPFIQPYLQILTNGTAKNNLIEEYTTEKFDVFWQLMQLAKKFVFSKDQVEIKAKNIVNNAKSLQIENCYNPFSTNSLISSILDIDGEPTITHIRRVRNMMVEQ